MVHEPPEQLDRSHYDRSCGHQLQGARSQQAAGIASDGTGDLWFTNAGNNSIGEISTKGVVTNYTGTGIDDPQGISEGASGATWFANAGNNSIGEITSSGDVTNFTGPDIDDPQGIGSGYNGPM